MFLFLWQTLYKVSDHRILVRLQCSRLFLTMIENVAKIDVLVKVAQSLPQTLYLAKSYIGLGQDEFEKFVACPNCCTLYKTEDCVIRKSNRRIVSKKCDHVPFPIHSQRSRRKQCGVFLMKNMRSKNGSLFVHPKNLYCFKKLSDSLRSLLKRHQDFLKTVNLAERESQQQIPWLMFFDGKVWKRVLRF